MTEHGKAQLRLLPTGVPNLDHVLGGGFPEYSCNLIAGDPGSGKTTLCHQIVFANASASAPALYFTIMGEPPLKMLRYQQQFSFFDPSKVDGSIHFFNLSRETLESLDNVLDAPEVREFPPDLQSPLRHRSNQVRFDSWPEDGDDEHRRGERHHVERCTRRLLPSR